MIEVTRLNGTKFVLNSDLIETMEETPDTVITLKGGNKYVVSESTAQLISLIAEFRRKYMGKTVKSRQLVRGVKLLRE